MDNFILRFRLGVRIHEKKKVMTVTAQPWPFSCYGSGNTAI